METLRKVIFLNGIKLNTYAETLLQSETTAGNDECTPDLYSTNCTMIEINIQLLTKFNDS